MKKGPKKFSQGIYLLPNLFTTANLFLGFYSIILTMKGYALQKISNYPKAALCIIGAALCDTIDGRLARMTKSSSQFGLEYDSLADLTSFGIAPALMAYSWGLRSFGKIGWLAAFLYFACVALRLARFNVQSKTVEKAGFQGMPCPAAAGFVAGIILLKPYFRVESKYDMIYLLIIPFLLALLMVSNIRYRNFKEVDLKKRFSVSIILAIVFLIILIAYQPIYTIFAIFTIYASSGLLEAFYRLFAKKQAPSVVRETKEIPSQNSTGS